jgi:hypothetical protein
MKLQRWVSSLVIMLIEYYTARGIQRRLEAYRHWYNEKRPHSALGRRTPEEVWRGKTLPEPVPMWARDQLPFVLEIRRQYCRGDPRLPVIQILRKAA